MGMCGLKGKTVFTFADSLKKVERNYVRTKKAGS
jgi:hypothetical protein